MKVMDRYILRELIVPFIAGSFLIALLFSANQLIYILKSFSAQNIPVSAMVQMLVYRLPYWLNLTLPAGVALAASLAVTRLARESEVTAIRTVGVRVVRLVLPIAVFGLVVGIGNYALAEKVMPRTELRARKLETDSMIANATPMFSSNVWLSLKGGYRASFGSVSRQGEDELLIQDVVLGQRPATDTVTFITAPQGTYKNGIWRFESISFWDLSPKGLKLTAGTGKTLTIPQPIFLEDVLGAPQEPLDKTAAELAADIKTGKAAGRDMTHEEVLYHERFSFPAACIISAIVSPIFALMFARSGSFAGVLLSFVLVLLYYNANVISTEIFGRNHW
ncbi:MAG: LptF/LptG family permease, partial [Fimbriimonadales bacterium]